MATLADSIFNTKRDLTARITVNGVTLLPTSPTDAQGVPGWSSINIKRRIGTAASCTIELNRTSTIFNRGDEVRVYLGYDGISLERFGGKVTDRQKRIGSGTLTCEGKLAPIFDTAILGERDFTGMTIVQAIADVLDDVKGEGPRVVTATPSFTLGTAVDAVVGRMTAAEMIELIMGVLGHEMWEGGDHTIFFKIIDRLPAPTAFRTYTTSDNNTARIIASALREDPKFTRTKVRVDGATTATGTLFAEAVVTDSELIKPKPAAGVYREAGVRNQLMDTQDAVNDAALRYLGQWHRVPKYLDISIPGDPELELAMTLGLVIPEQDIDGRFFIESIEEQVRVDSSGNVGYITILEGLRGGDELGGTLAISPQAAFTMHVEREVFGTGTTDFVVVTLDASASIDPDGSLTGTYTWTSNKTTVPTMASSTAKSRTVRIDSASLDGSGTDWTITLVVTDDDGFTDTITQTVPYLTTDTVTIPAIGLAYNSGAGLTPNGGQSWNDVTGATCISVALRPSDGVHFGHAVYGFSNGVIKRTIDGNLTHTTEYTFASGAAVNCVAWDWRNTNVVWALSANMELAISVDAGDTWTIYDSLRSVTYVSGAATASAIAGRRAIGLPAAGGVYVFGGDGAGVPLIAYDAVVGGHQWVHVAFTGDLATDIATPADATMKIVDYSAPGYGTEAMILSWASGGAAGLVAIYSTTSAPGTSRAFTRATGLTAGLKNGIYIVGDAPSVGDGVFRAAFGDRDVWSSTNGIAFSKTADVMPVNVTPNDAIWAAGILTGLPDFVGLYLVAAQISAGDTVGLYKSADGLASVTVLRPAGGSWPAWPASGKGKYVSIGAPGGAVAGDGKLLAITKHTGATARAARYRVNSLWQGAVQTQLATTEAKFYAYALSASLWFVAINDGDTGSPADMDQPAAHTEDGGLTWNTSLARMASVARAANGDLWGIGYDTDNSGAQNARISKSTDDGDNWSAIKHVNDGTPPPYNYGNEIICHPTDANKIFAFGRRTTTNDLWTLYTANGGSSWTYTSIADTITANKQELSAVWLPNGRILYTLRDSTGAKIYKSDDNGVTRTQVYSDAGGTNIRYHMIARNVSGSKIVVWRVDTSGGTYVMRALVSLDAGENWTLLTPDIGSGTIDSEAGAYDGAVDALYIAYVTGKIFRLTPVSNDGVWTEITDNLMAFGGYTTGTIADGALAVIPE